MQYQWIAVYGLNDTLAQYPPEGGENKYANIDRDRIRQFVVITREENPRTALVVHIPKGGRLIYRQRVEKAPGDKETRVWIVGSQSTVDGKNNQFISVLFEDGHVEVIDRWLSDSRWFHEPILHPHEGEVWEGLVAPEPEDQK